MKKVGFILFFTVLMMLVLSNCIQLEPVNTVQSSLLLPSDSGVIFKFTHRYFILVPQDTALFYGSRRCTTLVNGTITDLVDDSAYLRTITLDGQNIQIGDSTLFVIPQHYQQSNAFSKINSNTITRYFKMNDSIIAQVAFKEKLQMNPLAQEHQLFMPRSLIIGPYGWFQSDTTTIPINHKWPVTPIITNHFLNKYTNDIPVGFSVATQTIALQGQNDQPYFVNGNSYIDGIMVKTFYTLSHTSNERGMVVQTRGAVAITRTYFNFMGMIDQSMVSSIQRTFSDGTVELIRETIYVARGYEGAKVYPDEK